MRRGKAKKRGGKCEKVGEDRGMKGGNKREERKGRKEKGKDKKISERMWNGRWK